MPPIADNGIAVKINKEYLIEPKAKYNSNRMSPKATGTATDNR